MSTKKTKFNTILFERQKLPDRVVEDIRQLVKEYVASFGCSGMPGGEQAACCLELDSQILEDLYCRYIADERRPSLTYRQYVEVVKGLSGLNAA